MTWKMDFVELSLHQLAVVESCEILAGIKGKEIQGMEKVDKFIFCVV
jgi:hypothetical protein